MFIFIYNSLKYYMLRTIFQSNMSDSCCMETETKTRIRNILETGKDFFKKFGIRNVLETYTYIYNININCIKEK